MPTLNFDITIRNDELSNQTDEYEDTEDIEETVSDNQELGGHGLRDWSKILKPLRYRDAEINIAEGLEPLTYKEAMESPNAQFWKEAMHEELNFLKENDVYEYPILPPGQKLIDSKNN